MPRGRWLRSSATAPAARAIRPCPETSAAAFHGAVPASGGIWALERGVPTLLGIIVRDEPFRGLQAPTIWAWAMRTGLNERNLDSAAVAAPTPALGLERHLAAGA